MLLKDCLPFLIHDFKSEADLIRAIQELSAKFTVQRNDISDYLKEPRLVAAYTAFYLTTNYPKLREVLKWLPAGWVEELKSCPFIDLGAGPGTFGLAWRDFVGKAERIYQVELSGPMREQARRLWEGFYPDSPMEQLTSSRELSGSFILFGHSANEMGVKDSLKYIREMKADHVLFIEPGTKSFFPQMLEIRKSLLQEGFNVLYPCPSSAECPMARSEVDWCHQFIHVRHSVEVERLTQLVKKDRKLLPLTVHAYSRTFKHHEGERVVRVHPPTKFSAEWDVCLGEKVERYQIFRRGLDKQAQKELDEVLAGDSVETSELKALENVKRVALTKINNKDMSP